MNLTHNNQSQVIPRNQLLKMDFILLSRINMALQLTPFKNPKCWKKTIHFHNFGFLKTFNCIRKLCPTNIIARHAVL